MFSRNRMTIRLRLTLLYSAILALVVVVFSVLLYSFQSQATLRIVHGTLEREYGRVVDSNLRTSADEPPPVLEESPQNAFITPLIQFRTLDDSVVYRSENLDDTVLPLSEAGRQTVIDGEVWLERIQLYDDWFLIRSEVGEVPEYGTIIVQTALSVSNEVEYLNELRTILVIGDLIVMILAFGLGWTFTGVTLRPIQSITKTAKAVGEERDFSRRVEHTGPDDEIGQLAMTFNGMLAQLQDAYVQIEHSLQMQRRFVADASHELRTPLTTIRGNMELLQHQPALDAEERADILADAIEETDRLMRLVSELLTLARTDAQKSVQTEPLRVQPLLRDVCEQVQQLSRQHTIDCQPGDDALVLGNRDALRQVLLVLLDNAVKHTPPGTTVTVSAASNGERVAIRVQDDGPGMEEATLAHIFERFYRGDVVRTGPGAGLGLSIASELTKNQGGTITVESAVGKGSLFSIAFPVPPTDEEQSSMP